MPDQDARVSWWKRRWLLLFCALLLMAAGLGGGLWLSDRLSKKWSIPARALAKAESIYNSVFVKSGGEAEIKLTPHVRLSVRSLYLPLEVTDDAGSIFGLSQGGILILDRAGKLFLTNGTDVERIGIEPPPNKLDLLLESAGRDELINDEITEKWFRYNDVFYLERNNSAFLFYSYTEWTPEDKCFLTTLARLEVDPDSPPAEWSAEASDWKILKRTQPCLALRPEGDAVLGMEAGGRLAYSEMYPDSILWTTGSYGRDDLYPGTDFSGALAQDDATDYGKILRVDIESGASTHLAKGLRNPQGIDVDGQGRIWVTDHGMRGGDELNLVTQGANFGYPAVSYGVRYTYVPVGNTGLHQGHDGYTQPVISWVPSIAPSSVMVIKGFHYAWDGDLLVTSFRGLTHRIKLQEQGIAFDEPDSFGPRLRDVTMNAQGEIVLWTDSRRLIFVRPDESPGALEQITARLRSDVDPEHLQSAEEALTSCSQCHDFEGGENSAGPPLEGVCGRQVGSTGFAGYSDGMSKAGGTWDRQRLARFIAAPQEVVPDNAMQWDGMDSDIAQQVADAICPDS